MPQDDYEKAREKVLADLVARVKRSQLANLDALLDQSADDLKMGGVLEQEDISELKKLARKQLRKILGEG
jgi:hypothetical protein